MNRLKVGFWVGVLGLVLTEIANVYFIMPMPGSQQMRSIDAAYAIYSWRWPLRAFFGVMIAAGLAPAWRTSGWRRWLVPASLVVAGIVAYAFSPSGGGQRGRQEGAGELLHRVPHGSRL